MQIETTSNLKHEIIKKESERQRIAKDMANFKGMITIVKPAESAHNHAESKTTQQRDELAFKRAETIRAEREAANKARKIRSLATVIRRHKKRSAEQ